MNPAADLNHYPPPADFVAAMWNRVYDAYPRVMSVVATAIVQAGGDRDAMVRMVSNKANRAAFLMGCCAEELVSTGFQLKGREARRYIGEVVEALRPLAQPIRSKRVAPEFRRLLAEYEHHPIRMRVKTIHYMLAVNGLKNEQALVSENATCQLQIECSVMVDSVAGNLMDMMKREASASSEVAATEMMHEAFGPVISSTLHRLQ